MVANALQWLVHKTHQVRWESLLDYGRLEWQQSLTDLQKAPNVAYENVLKIFDNIWCVKHLVVTRSNVVVT